MSGRPQGHAFLGECAVSAQYCSINADLVCPEGLSILCHSSLTITGLRGSCDLGSKVNSIDNL